MRRHIVIIMLGFCALAAQASAQERTVPPDSLQAQIRRLQARLDSLERVLAQLTKQGKDTAAVQDELAALRAAAQQVTGENVDTARVGETRTRSLSVMNPEISATGDVVGGYLAPTGGDAGFRATPREFELSFQSALDPYTRTKIFATYEEDPPVAGLEVSDTAAAHGSSFEIEEGYLYWVGLPGALGLKVGKFRQEIGLYNRWHTHALQEIDRPLAAATFLGPDGLIQTGLSLTSPALSIGPSTQSLFLEATQGTNEALFQDGNDLSFLGRLQSFWDVGPGTWVQFGATGVTGKNGDVGLDTRLLGLDFAFHWAPPNRAIYRSFELKSEWYFARQDLEGVRSTGNGGYGQANFRVNRSWVLGTRVDYVEGYDGATPILQVVPSVSWWQSEWVRLRLQYNLVKPRGIDASHTVMVQVVWAMGPHKHETY
jgi:hypothetical protein